MIDLPSSDQASSEGPALIPIVGNNTERGVNQYYQVNYFSFHTELIYPTSVSENRIYTQLQIKKPSYIKQTYNLNYLSDVSY